MTKITDSHIREINKTLVGITMSMPLGYIVGYHHGRDEYVMKKTILHAHR